MLKENNLALGSPDGKNAFKLSFVNEFFSHLLGEVLTIIDASTEGEKNKAMKDLIRERFYVKTNRFIDLAWKETEGVNEGHSSRERWESGLVPFEEDKKISFK